MVLKKVRTIRIAFQMPDGSWVTEDYMAEFNDATINGDISMLGGTFAGTLTANAIDAVSNITIAGENVARTVAMVIPGFSAIPQGQWYDIASGYITVPQSLISSHSEDIRIMVFVQYHMKVQYDDASEQEFKKPISFRVNVGGRIDDLGVNFAGKIYDGSPSMSHEFIVRGNVGQNFVSLQAFIPTAGKNIVLYANDRRIRMDAVVR